jgi:1-acyl-sn-glycerol-3-phosphate acyltransferase
MVCRLLRGLSLWAGGLLDNVLTPCCAAGHPFFAFLMPMIQRISSVLKWFLTSVTLMVNTLTVFALMIPFALIKLVLRVPVVRRPVDAVLNALATIWIDINGVWMALVGRTRWHVLGATRFDPKGWYLVSSNHQSWVDILVLQKLFNRKIPMLKFFIKHELIYVPVIGLAWWALDFPFMKRRGGATAAQDLAKARESCEKFKLVPTSVISFVEGTRYTPAKAKEQKSPFQHLLRPKIGGVGMALETMGELFQSMLDVTIVYPKGVPTFVDLLTGQLSDVIVSVREVPIPGQLLVNERGEAPPRAALQTWVNEMWQAKDAEIAQLKADFQAGKLRA